MHSRAHAHTHPTYTLIHAKTHTRVLVLAPFLLANDTMVTEQPVSPCVPWPSLVSESKITTGTTLGRRGAVGRSRRATGGGVEGAGGGWEGGEGNWKKKRLRGERMEASDIYVPGQQKMPLQTGISLSFSVALCSLPVTWGSLTTLTSIPITQFWPSPFGHFSFHFHASTSSHFHRSVVWPLAFI